MKFGSTRFRALGAAVTIVALGTTLVACGGDDDDDDAASSDTTAAAAASDDVAQVCDINIQVAAATAPIFEAEDPEGVKAAYADSGVADLFDQVDALDLPDELSGPLGEAMDTIRTAGETGDTSGLQDFDTTDIDAWFYDNCDYQQVPVTAKEYEFDGLPATLDAGATSFQLTNSGDEMHEIVIARKADGVTDSWDDILALPEEEAMAKVAIAGAAFAPIGATGYFATDLDAGDYVAVCFIPQGTKSFEDQLDAPPHMVLGMKHEFTVS